MELSTKLIYNPIIFQEPKLLSKCVISCELLPRMAEEPFVIGRLHLADLCSGNVILAQRDPVRKIGCESNTNRENFYVPQKSKLQQRTNSLFQITGHKKGMPFRGIYS